MGSVLRADAYDRLFVSNLMLDVLPKFRGNTNVAELLPSGEKGILQNGHPRPAPFTAVISDLLGEEFIPVDPTNPPRNAQSFDACQAACCCA